MQSTLLCRERHGMWGSREIPKEVTDRRATFYFQRFFYNKNRLFLDLD